MTLYCSEGQTNGIWAWDCVEKEPVVVIPSVLALLGDNPMQSEFCSHTGLTSNLFCRICYCKKLEQDSFDSEDDGDENNKNDTTCTEEEASEPPQRGTKKGKKWKKTRKKKRTQGTMQDWVDCAWRFMTVSYLFLLLFYLFYNNFRLYLLFSHGSINLLP